MDMIKGALHRVLRLPNYILSQDYFIFTTIDLSPYYVFVALCIVVIVVSLIKIAASNENIECFREYFAVGYRAPDPRLAPSLSFIVI